MTISLCAHADVNADESLYTSSNFLPIVTSSARIPQLLTDAAATTTIITRDMIETAGIINLPEVFRLIPGFQVFRVNANKYAVSYHGMSDDFPNLLEVRVDQRSVYLPMMSAVDWTSLGITLDDIERIEIVRGSNSAAQGTNAFLGSINIETRNPVLAPKASLSTTLGSDGLSYQNLSYAHTSNDASYRVSASSQANDGNSHFDDGMDRGVINFSMMRPLGLYTTLNLHVGVDKGHIVSSTDYNDIKAYSKREHEGNSFQLNLEHLLSNQDTLSFSISRTHLKLDTRNATAQELMTFFGISQPLLAQNLLASNPGLKAVAEVGKGETWNSELLWKQQFQNLTWVNGIDASHDTVSSDVFLHDGTENDSRAGIFSTLEWRVAPKWTSNTGLRIEDATHSDTAYSARQSLSYKLTPDSSVRVALAHSERLPSLLEKDQNIRFYTSTNQLAIIDTAANPDLKNEKNNTVELGYYHAFSANDYLDLRLYTERITDSIASYRRPVTLADTSVAPLFGDGTLRTRGNINEWTNSGLELQTRTALTDELSLLLNYAYQHTDGDVATLNQIGASARDASPTHTASALLSWAPTERWQFGAAHYYQSPTQWLQNAHTQQPRYERTDLTASYTQPFNDNWQLRSRLILQGVFSPDYSEYSVGNDFSRGAFIEFQLTQR